MEYKLAEISSNMADTMSKFRIKFTKVLVVHQYYTEEFDPKSKSDWLSLMERLQEQGAEIDDYSKEQPEDIDVWYEAYSQLDEGSFAEEYDDCVSESNGTTEYYWTITDPKGKVLIND